jgi:heptaprenyl diphosphate synthase
VPFGDDRALVTHSAGAASEERMPGADQLTANARNEVRSRLADAGTAMALDGMADFVAGGKLLRSALVIHAARLGDTLLPLRMVRYATALELIHAGALCHDDVVDGSRMRRGKPSVVAAVGPRAAVLAGLHLLARGAEMLAAEPMVVRRFVARAVRDAARGQVEELYDAFDEHVPPRACLDRARAKTASLYELGAWLGARSSTIEPRVTDAAAQFGAHFGMAFQLADDVRDLIGDPALGREPGTDIRQGIYTLPVLWTLVGPRGDGDRLRCLLRQGVSAPLLAEVTGLLRTNGMVARTTRLAARYVDRACAALRSLPRPADHVGLVEAARALLDGMPDATDRPPPRGCIVSTPRTMAVVPEAMAILHPPIPGMAALVRAVESARPLEARFRERLPAGSSREAPWLDSMASALAVAATALVRSEEVSSERWEEGRTMPAVADTPAIASVDLLVADFFTLLCSMPGRAGTALARLLADVAARAARRATRHRGGSAATSEADLIELADEAGRFAAAVLATGRRPD